MAPASQHNPHTASELRLFTCDEMGHFSAYTRCLCNTCHIISSNDAICKASIHTVFHKTGSQSLCFSNRTGILNCSFNFHQCWTFPLVKNEFSCCHTTVGFFCVFQNHLFTTCITDATHPLQYLWHCRTSSSTWLAMIHIMVFYCTMYYWFLLNCMHASLI